MPAKIANANQKQLGTQLHVAFLLFHTTIV